MASSYPASPDSFDTIASDKKTSDAVGGRTHRDMHNDLGDAIEAIETELGTTPSGSETTVAARLTAIENGTRLGTGSVAGAALADGAVTAAKLARPIGNLLTDNQASGTDALLNTSDFGGTLDCTLASSSAWSQSGSRSVALVCATRSYDYLYADVNDDPVAVTAGSVYSARAVAYSYPTPRTAAAAIIWYNSGGGVVDVSTGGYVATNTSSGVDIAVTAVAPTGAVTAVMRLYVDDATRSTTDVHYFDELSLHRGAGGLWAMPGASTLHTGLRPNPANTAQVQVWNDATSAWITV